MNRLPVAKRAQIIQMLVEGSSLRATSRIADVSINTVTKLLVDVAEAAFEFHNRAVVNVRARRIQCDEIWCFAGPKEKTVTPEQKPHGRGDVWTWTAIDADTKLCLSYLVGGRDGGSAYEFMQDVTSRVRGCVQLTTDGHKPYLEAVAGAYGMDVDFATLLKIYGAPNGEEARRYSPAKCVGANIRTVLGDPSPKQVSTRDMERTSMRRFTRLARGFSKKIENQAAAVALHFIHYNFARLHKTLRIAPAMAAGLSDHIWSFEEIAVWLDKRGKYGFQR